MVPFLILGMIVTIGAGTILYFGLSIGSQFLFGPFIGLVVGINFIFLTIVRMYQIKRRQEDGT
ncbi:hypothetical protein [Alkalihalobacillus sp. BA299]|uniref:hypothetical protein n=1 Tax=Alkalihalobacillus sp. BA299 TaxID=2815938 RepID=UPI001AD9C616|nr:hypothetical protein [Alkalihalobacillus sp. BA299]